MSTQRAEEPPRGPRKDVKKRFSVEDVIVTSAVFLGFGAGIVLAVLKQPPALVAVVLAAGVSALVHRFLGGLQGGEILFGAIKLVGAVGALMGVFFILNHYLVEQQQKAYETTLAGPWRWTVTDKEQAWVGNFTFGTPSGHSEVYPVTGRVKEARTGKVLFEVLKGTAERKGGDLKLSWQVKDYVHDRTVTWETTTPLAEGIVFDGTFNPRYQGQLDPESWGIYLSRPAAGG